MYSQILYFLIIIFLNYFSIINGISIKNEKISARVKREKFDKNNNDEKLQANYLEDLAASFPKSEHELDEKNSVYSITSEKIEDDKVFKRSSISNNEKKLIQSCHMKVNRNLENPRIYQINSNLNDNQKRRHNNNNNHYRSRNAKICNKL